MSSQTSTVLAQDLRAAYGLLTDEELAAMLELRPETLAKWRIQKTGPSFTYLGKGVFYRRDDVLAWIQSCVQPVPDEHMLINSVLSHGQ